MGNPMETTDYIILIGNTIYTYIHLWESVEYVLRGDMQWGEILFQDAFLCLCFKYIPKLSIGPKYECQCMTKTYALSMQWLKFDIKFGNRLYSKEKTHCAKVQKYEQGKIGVQFCGANNVVEHYGKKH